ncbi:MAG: glutamate-5-semialdehyde dehydrogenase [Deltaproteobacteria bacterium]|nr:glutamate-5-semialdehyde dehydrogenase [Deltaproteobacteria bacterium]
MILAKKIQRMAERAREAAREVAIMPTEAKNYLLLQMADALLAQKETIHKQNQKDLKEAWQKKLSPALTDRLTLTDKRIEEMAHRLQEVSGLPDPVGQIVKSWVRPNRLEVSRIRIPLGVIGMIYESRPNVTVDAAGLCLKSGNAILLRGGSEAFFSNRILGRILQGVLKKDNKNPDMIQVVETTARQGMESLVRQSGTIDLIIPRGGEGLMRWIERHSKIPVLKHDKGVCHIFVDEEANLEMAEKIAFNAKVQRPGVCNAMETLLVHEKIAPHFLPRIVKKMEEAGVEIRGDAGVRKIVPHVNKATKKDWSAEYLDLILAVRVVPGLEEVIRHIQKYGSSHTESIVTENRKTAAEFLRRLDSSVVLWNASTRFNDGGQLGLGAEMGISTTKLHAFGPMGLEELTTTKFVVKGNGQIRE